MEARHQGPAGVIAVAGLSTRMMRRQRLGDTLFRAITRGFAFGVLLLLGAIIASLAAGSIPAFRAFGLGFLFSTAWNPVKDAFGALPAIYGTLVTSFIAMALAVPLAFGIAIFLTELCPPLLRRPIGTLIELLAAIPSIIYGIWGLFVLAPVLQSTLQPMLIGSLGEIPLFGVLFAGPPLGLGILTASIILAVMVLPFIASVSRDVFLTVPPLLRESAYGMGATTSEVIRNIIIPHSRIGRCSRRFHFRGLGLEPLHGFLHVGNEAHVFAAPDVVDGIARRNLEGDEPSLDLDDFHADDDGHAEQRRRQVIEFDPRADRVLARVEMLEQTVATGLLDVPRQGRRRIDPAALAHEADGARFVHDNAPLERKSRRQAWLHGNPPLRFLNRYSNTNLWNSMIRSRPARI